jgi:hypothetical protein
MTTQPVRDHRRYAEQGTTRRPRVATYTRTNTSGSRSASLQVQETRLRDHINQRDWNLVATYTDQGCGGATRQRTGLGLQQALTDARNGQFDTLLVDSLDRLARSTPGLTDVLRQLEAAGVTCQSRGRKVRHVNRRRPVAGTAPRSMRRLRPGTSPISSPGRVAEPHPTNRQLSTPPVPT